MTDGSPSVPRTFGSQDLTKAEPSVVPRTFGSQDLKEDVGSMKQKAAYEFVDHMADVKFRAFGRTIEECFESAGTALFDVMLDGRLDTVEGRSERTFELSSGSLELLLYEWLSELLYCFEVEGLLFGRFEVECIKEDTEGDCTLRCTGFGEQFNDRVHKIGVHVKGITLHEMEIKHAGDVFVAQVVVDT